MSLQAQFSFNENASGNILISGSSFGTVNKDSFITKSGTLNLPRIGATSSVLNGKIYVFGGTNVPNGTFNSIYEYNPSTDNGVLKTSTLSQLTVYASSAVSNGKIYIFGGNNSSTYYNTISEYDPVADTINVKSSAFPTGLSQTGAVTATNGKIYIFGGSSAASTYSNAIYEYNPSTDTLVTKTTVLPTTRTGLNAVLSTNGKIYIFGGNNASNFNTIIEYDPILDVITTKSALLPSATTLVSCVAAPTGKIYLFGGAAYLGILEYDSIADTIKSRFSNSFFSRNQTTTAYYNGKIYSLGGYDGSYLSSIIEYSYPSFGGPLNFNFNFSGDDVKGISQPLLTSSTTGINISRIQSGGSGLNEIQNLSVDGNYLGDNIVITGSSSTQTIIVGMTPLQVQSKIEDAYAVRNVLSIRDSGPNNLVGTLYGDLFPVSSPISGNCLSFDGVNDYVSLGNVLDLTGSTSLTCICWVKCFLSGSNPLLILVRDNGTINKQYSFIISSTNYPEFKVNSTSYTSTIPITDALWHQIAFVWNGSIVKFFIDGVFSNSVAASTTLPTYSNLQTYIGRSNGNANGKGSIDNLLFFDSEESDATVASMYSTVNYNYRTSINATSFATLNTKSTSIPINSNLRTDVVAPQRLYAGQLFP